VAAPFATKSASTFLESRIDQAVVERLLERMIGRMIDVNYHLITDGGQAPPPDYPASFLKPAELALVDGVFPRRPQRCAGRRVRRVGSALAQRASHPGGAGAHGLPPGPVGGIGIRVAAAADPAPLGQLRAVSRRLAPRRAGAVRAPAARARAHLRGVRPPRHVRRRPRAGAPPDHDCQPRGRDDGRRRAVLRRRGPGRSWVYCLCVVGTDS